MRCVIISGGTVINYAGLIEMIGPGDRVICVDGGAKHAADIGLVPHMIVGDMDSVGHAVLKRLAGQGTVVREHPVDKDHTDTALAVAEALALKPDEIIILGALGTRFDHSLANVHLLRVALERGVRARIINEHNEISLVAPGMPAVVEGKPGDLFSLLPLTEEVTGVYVRGAKWPLGNAVFRIGSPYGISNRLAAARADITAASGLLLLIKITDRGED